MIELAKKYWWVLAAIVIGFVLWRRRVKGANSEKTPGEGKAVQSVKLNGGGYSASGIVGKVSRSDPYNTGTVGNIDRLKPVL